MRITKGQLRRIIQEEIGSSLLKENRAADQYRVVASDIVRDIERIRDAIQIEPPEDCDWSDTETLMSIADTLEQLANRVNRVGEYGE